MACFNSHNVDNDFRSRISSSVYFIRSKETFCSPTKERLGSLPRDHGPCLRLYSGAESCRILGIQKKTFSPSPANIKNLNSFEIDDFVFQKKIVLRIAFLIYCRLNFMTFEILLNM